MSALTSPSARTAARLFADLEKRFRLCRSEAERVLLAALYLGADRTPLVSLPGLAQPVTGPWLRFEPWFGALTSHQMPLTSVGRPRREHILGAADSLGLLLVDWPVRLPHVARVPLALAGWAEDAVAFPWKVALCLDGAEYRIPLLPLQQASLEQEGWTVLRASAEEVEKDPGPFLEQIASRLLELRFTYDATFRASFSAGAIEP